jgi:hypothetical protein
LIIFNRKFLRLSKRSAGWRVIKDARRKLNVNAPTFDETKIQNRSLDNQVKDSTGASFRFIRFPIRFFIKFK